MSDKTTGNYDNVALQKEMQPCDPVTAKRIIESRRLPKDIYSPPVELTHLSLTGSQPSNAAAGTKSIAEQARALRHDVDLIYQFITENVEWVPVFGTVKGGLGCLIDGRGGSFDISTLMVELLRASGYTANFLVGQITLPAGYISNWLGCVTTPAFVGPRILTNGGIPNTYTTTGVDTLDTVTMTHCWVKVNIDGTDYMFDPSLKSYVYVEGVDVASAMGYSATTHMSDALSGATVDPNFIDNLNRGNIRTNLNAYASNLLSWIRTNMPAATIDEVLGGRYMDTSFWPYGPRDTSLWYQTPGDTPTQYTDIPLSYKVTVNVQFFTINQTFVSDQLWGRRLSIFHTSSTNAELRLDGTLIQSTTTPGGGTANINVTITRNAYTSNNVQSGFAQIYTPAYQTVIALGDGDGYVDVYREKMREDAAAGLAATSEQRLGNGLVSVGETWFADARRAFDVIGRISKCRVTDHGGVVFAASDTTTNQVVFLGGVGLIQVLTLDAVNYPLPELAAFNAVSMHGGTIEELCINHSVGVKAVSCARVLDNAMASGDKMFDATASNWNQIIGSLFWSPTLLTLIRNNYIPDHRVIMPENEFHPWEDWNGAGWGRIQTTSFPGIEMGYITGGITAKGGHAAKAGYPAVKPKEKKCPCCKDDHPENDPEKGDLSMPGIPGLFGMPSGPALTVGSGDAHPHKLEFNHHYSSVQSLQNGPLGLGWSHNHDMSVRVDTECSRGLGESGSPIDAIATIVNAYVCFDLLNLPSSNRPYDRVITAVCGLAWWVDQLYQSTVIVNNGSEDIVFQKLPDGTYNPPLNNSDTLILNGDGTFTHKTKEQVTLNFNTDRKVAAQVFPSGVTVTYTYSSGKLQSISNGMGRTLTLGYTGDYLTNVSDGTGRSIGYSVNGTSKQLESFTNADSKVYTYEYNAAGLLWKAFKPANPTVPVVTVEYDTLNRVKSRKNALNQEWTYFLAGSRSEVLDPLGNQYAQYWDAQGNRFADVNALGQTTRWTHDGLGRLIRQELPEGNALEWTYDSKHNVLTRTRKAKPGSPLADTQEVFTYHPTYNKVATARDARLSTTTFGYDSATGNLLTIQRPMVDGLTPQVTFTWNGRGQVLTRTDETGIVTKFEYDTATEKLDRVIVDFGTTPHLNLTTQFGYNSRGDVTSVQNPRAFTTVLDYDLERRLKQKTDPAPLSYVTKWTFDPNGNQTKVERQTDDPLNPWQTINTTYSVTDKEETISGPAANLTTKVYDGADRLWKVTQQVSATELRTTEFLYDELNRIYQVIDPSSTVAETRTYTLNGRLYQVTDARNKTTTWSWDGFDRQDRTTYPNASYEQNVSMDANDNVLTFRTRSGNTIVSTFDVLNRLKTKLPQGQPLVSFTYDLAGRLLKANKPLVSGDPSSGDFQFGFDSAGRFYRETLPDAKVVQHLLDENGNQKRTTWPDGYFVERSFDEIDRLKDIKLNGSATPALQFQLDPLSRRKQLSYQNGVVSTYSYSLDDNLTSLLQSFVGSAVTFGYGFNRVHQLTTQTVSDQAFMWHPPLPGTQSYATANDVNQYPSVGGIPHSYDGNGNLTGDGVRQYGYDTENHMVTANLLLGATLWRYRYDPMHRQAQKEVGPLLKTRFIYAGWQRIADYDGVTGALQNRYVYGTGLDEPLIQVAAGGALTYLHHDRLGSIIALTDGAGAVTNRYKYSPWGEPSSMSGTSFGFTGQRYDGETGNWFFRNRYLSNRLGRFLQVDPIGYTFVDPDGPCTSLVTTLRQSAPSELNLYSYVFNDPLNYIDPLGTMGSPVGGFKPGISQPTNPPVASVRPNDPNEPKDPGKSDDPSEGGGGGGEPDFTSIPVEWRPMPGRNPAECRAWCDSKKQRAIDLLPKCPNSRVRRKKLREIEKLHRQCIAICNEND